MRFLILKFISANDLTPFSLVQEQLCVVPYFSGYGAITTITLNNFHRYLHFHCHKQFYLFRF